jgi:hypothetical protein
MCGDDFGRVISSFTLEILRELHRIRLAAIRLE